MIEEAQELLDSVRGGEQGYEVLQADLAERASQVPFLGWWKLTENFQIPLQTPFDPERVKLSEWRDTVDLQGNLIAWGAATVGAVVNRHGRIFEGLVHEDLNRNGLTVFELVREADREGYIFNYLPAVDMIDTLKNRTLKRFDPDNLIPIEAIQANIDPVNS